MQENWQSALDKWERHLQSRLPEVTLLGELKLGEADRDCIAAALRSAIAAMGPAPFMQEVKARWPVTLTAYLVVEGVFSYRKGALWPHVCARLGLPNANYPARWGRICVETVRQYGKPDFRDLVAQEHATRYLTVILAHGGIPNSCLPDLFRYVPGHLGRGRAMPCAAELMERWRNDPGALRHVDHPVRRFLLYGGKIAVDFLVRYLRLVGYAREHATVPDHSQVGLPAHVVHAYRQWRATRDAQRTSRQRPTTRQAPRSTRRQRPRASPTERRERASARRRASWRIAAPFLALDPYNAGAVVIHLPRQRLNDDRVTKELTWIVRDGNHEERLAIHLWPSGSLLLSEERSYEISNVSPKYHVTLLFGDQFKREWCIRGISDDLPLLVFRDNTTMKALDRTDIPAGRVWLLIHKSLVFNPDVIPEIEIQLTDNWSEYTAYRVNLEGYQALPLKMGGVALDSIPLHNQKNVVDFISNPLFITEDADGEIWIFTEPPLIGIPLGPGQKVDAQLSRCFLRLGSTTFGSKSNSVKSVKASDLEYTLQEDGRMAQVALASLLPSPALGVFELHVQRALGQDQQLRFAVIPGMQVEGQDRLVLPLPDGRPRPTTIHVSCPASGRLVAEQNGLKVQPGPVSDDQPGATAVWQVNVDAALDTVALRYEDPSQTAGKITIPLTIPVPRLCWRITGLAIDATPSKAETLRVRQDSFTAAAEPTLIVTVPDGTDLTSLRVVLKHPGGTQEIPAGNPKHRSLAGRCSFPLGICQDTVRQVTDQAELSVTLEVQRKGQATPDQLEVLRITCPPRPAPPVPSAPPKAPSSKSAHSHPGFTQEVAASHAARRAYSFTGGALKDSSARDPLLGRPFREAPDPKSLKLDSNGDLIIEVGGRRYAPACNKCGCNPKNIARRSSYEPGSVFFTECMHRISFNDVILGRPVR